MIGALNNHRIAVPTAAVLVPAFLSILLVVTMPPARALPLLVLTGAALAVLVEPRVAYILLPITVPWGSEFGLSVAQTPITASDLIVASLLGSWCVRACQVRDARLAWNRWTFALALLILAMALSTWQAASIMQSIKELTKWIEVLVVASLAPTYLRTARDVWLVVAATVGAAATEAVLGLGQFLLHLGPRAFEIPLPGGTRQPGAPRFLRAYGTFGQPNPMAGYLNMVLPVAVATGWARRNPWYLGAGALIALGSAATFSRSGWAAAAIAIVALSAFHWKRLRSALVVAGAGASAAILLAVLSFVPTSPFTKLASSFGLTAVDFKHHTHANFSEVERAAHWVAGLRMFDAHPLLGVGIGNYPIAYPAYRVAAFTQPLGHAHNYFINIAAEAGILGLVAFTFLIVAAFVWVFAVTVRAPRGSLAACLGLGVLGLWISSTFHNLFDVLYVHELPTLVGVLMGALMVAARLPDSLSTRAIPYDGVRIGAFKRSSTAQPWNLEPRDHLT